MQPMAYNRHKYSGDFYKFVRETVGDTSTVKYYFVGNIALSAGLDLSGRMVIRTDEPMALGCLIANIKDAQGNLILDNMIWQVSSLQPITNAFNTIQGYRVRVVKFQGTI